MEFTSTREEASFTRAIKALRQHLDFRGRAVTIKDFRQTTQHQSGPVADCARCLECTFYVAYGRDHMSAETRDTLLHGQLQEGLRLELMSAPAVYRITVGHWSFSGQNLLCEEQYSRP